METIKKSAKKFTIIITTFLILINFILPNFTYASAEDDDGWLGILFEPISFMVCGIGDGIINITQKIMLPGTPKAVKKRDGKVQPKIYYSSAAIFANKVPALDVNFISPSIKNEFLTDENISNLKKEGYNAKERETLIALKQSQNSNDPNQYINAGNSAAVLNGIISKWYVALRNIAILGLMIVLIYIGIRILISATAEEQAKYKTMIKDWVMAVILVIVIHFIMLLLLEITQVVIKMLDAGSVFDNGQDVLMNTVRSNIAEEKNSVTKMGYSIMYTTLIMYTFTFTMIYLKRVIYMAFLTFISPMVALTYPIDKMKDRTITSV